VNVTPFSIAQRYIGVREFAGGRDHPFIQWCLSLCGLSTDSSDEIPWCSAFLQHPFYELRLPRSESAAARSWLGIGIPIELVQATVGHTVIVLKRGTGEQPGPEVRDAPGHVGLYAGWHGQYVDILAGNQGNAVSVASFPQSRILGVRRIE